MSRGNRILAAVLAVQLVLVVAVFWPRSPTAAGGELLFAGLEADQIVRVRIEDENGEAIELAKNGAEWVLPQMGDYPCLPGAVPDLLDKLVALKGGQQVTETPDSHKPLKVAEDEFAQRVEFVLQDNHLYTLYLGTSPSYNAVHVRVGGQDEVYLASGLSAADVSARPGTWIDTLYFSVPQDEIVSLLLENANGRFEFAKNDDGGWVMPDLLAGEELDVMRLRISTQCRPVYGEVRNLVVLLHNLPPGHVDTAGVGTGNEHVRFWHTAERPFVKIHGTEGDG